MINYEYFDSVDDTEENKKHALTANDNSNIIDKIHTTINETFTLLPSLKTIIIITLVVVLIFMFTVYYVDYENVHAGVDGIDKLTANDTVRIFYSPKADTMRIAFVEQALRAQAKIELISVDVGTPNALDFH